MSSNLRNLLPKSTKNPADGQLYFNSVSKVCLFFARSHVMSRSDKWMCWPVVSEGSY